MPTPFELRLRPAVRERLDRLGHEFQADFLGRKATRAPESVEVLVCLARVLMRLGRHEEGLEVHERLVRLIPRNPIVHYNLACSQALCERSEDALDSLRSAIHLGYDDVDYMRRDEDLVSLREDPAFEALASAILLKSNETPSN